MNAIIIAHQKELAKEGLTRILSNNGYNIVGACSTATETIRCVLSKKPDILVLDSGISERGGIEVLEEIRKSSLDTRTVFVSEPWNGRLLPMALKAGARAYLNNQMSVEELVSSIHSVQMGEIVISPSFIQAFVCSAKSSRTSVVPKSGYGLSQREADILGLLVKGISNAEIAKILFISEHTVKVHLSHILNKMQVRNRQQAALLALKTGVAIVESGSYDNYKPRKKVKLNNL